MVNFNSFIGLPYKHLGRSKAGVDCMGLIWIIYKERLNITLPDFTDLKYEKDWYKKNENHILENIPDNWIKIEPPYRRYDVLIFYLGTKTIANHTAMWLGNEDDKFIHIHENITSRIDRLNNYWKSRLYGGMRFIGKNNV